MSAAPRLFVDLDLSPGSRIVLRDEAAHYLGRVLRLGPGDRVRVFNGREGEALSSVVALGRDRVELDIEAIIRPQTSAPDLWLLFAPLKKTRTDFLIEKASELGVSELRPVLTARCEAQSVRNDRLFRIAVEASEQCERLDVPTIRESLSLSAALSGWDLTRPLFVCEEGEETSPGVRVRPRPMAEVVREVGSPAGAILIGPEGGWTPHERNYLTQLSFVRPVSLGPRVLRAETAALAALALWQGLIGWERTG